MTGIQPGRSAADVHRHRRSAHSSTSREPSELQTTKRGKILGSSEAAIVSCASSLLLDRARAKILGISRGLKAQVNKFWQNRERPRSGWQPFS